MAETSPPQPGYKTSAVRGELVPKPVPLGDITPTTGVTAMHEHFIVGGLPYQVAISSETNHTILKYTSEMAARAAEGKMESPNAVIFGTHAHNKALVIEQWQARYDVAQGAEAKKALEASRPVWTREELGIAYLALMERHRADLAYLVRDPNPRAKGIRGRLHDFLVEDGPTGRLLARLFAGYDAFPLTAGEKVHTELVTLSGFAGLSTRDQLAEVERLNDVLKEIIHEVADITDNGDPLLALDQLTRGVLGGRESKNMLHNFIAYNVGGSDKLKREGVLSRSDQYRRYYPNDPAHNREWDDLNPAEKAQVWDALTQPEKDEVLYEATERAIGDWAENTGKSILEEVRGEYLPDDLQQQAVRQLEQHKLGDRIDTQRLKSEADSKATRLQGARAKALAERDRLVNDDIPAAKRNLETAKQVHAREQASLDAKVLVATANHTNASNNLTTAEGLANPEIAILQAQAAANIAGGGNSIEIKAQLAKDEELILRKYDIHNIRDKRHKTEQALVDAQSARAQIDVDLANAQNELDRLTKVELKGITKQLGGASGLEAKLKSALDEQARLQKLIEKGESQLSPEAEAIKTIIEVCKADNYNAINTSFYREETRELADGRINATTNVCSGLDRVRRLIFGNLQDAPYNPARAEAMLSDYDILKWYIKAFKMENVDLSEINSILTSPTPPAVGGGLPGPSPIDALNNALRAWDGKGALPAPVIAARGTVNAILQPVRDRVLGEIERRNKWEIGNAVRFSARGMLNKASWGEPFVFEEYKPEKPARKREKPDLIPEIPQEIIRQLDADGTPMGRNAMVQAMRFTDGSEYFLVTREDPDTHLVVQQLRDDRGHEVPMEGEVRDEVHMNTAIQNLNRDISNAINHETTFTIAGINRRIKRDTISGRLIEIDGPEKTTAGPTLVYLDEVVKTNGEVNAYLLNEGHVFTDRMIARLQNYISNVQNLIGTAETRVGVRDSIFWQDRDPVRIAAGIENITVRLGNGLLGEPTNIDLVGIPLPGGVPIPGVTDFASFDTRLNTLVNAADNNIGQYFYAALFDRFMDRDISIRRHFTDRIRTFPPLEIVTPSGRFEIRGENGNIIRKITHNAAGIALGTSFQEEEDLIEGFNNDLLIDPSYGQKILDIKTALGKEYMQHLFESHMERPQDRARGAGRGAGRRARRVARRL